MPKRVDCAEPFVVNDTGHIGSRVMSNISIMDVLAIALALKMPFSAE